MTITKDKKADLAGPGISTYEQVEKVLPEGYQSLLNRKETMQALFSAKNYIEENLAKELNLMMVQVPLIVDADSGMNDMLDRDGSRTPVSFPCGLGIAPAHSGAGSTGRHQMETFCLETVRMQSR